MSTRLTWLVGLIVLISMGWLMACGSHYSASSDGLVIVPSQGSAVLQAFRFNLSNGNAAQINTAPNTNGKPSAIVLDPAGAFAYVLVDQNTIATFKVNADGTLSGVGTTPDPSPVALAMDTAGKFLFVAEGLGGAVSVYSIGSNASLSAVPGSPFLVPPAVGGAQANLVALAVTPLSFPVLNTTTGHNAACSGEAAPTTEFLYVVDAVNNEVWDFGVNMSSGALGNPGNDTSIPSFATGLTPSGVAVDPCNRFVYVANSQSNNVSGYTICNAILLPNCPAADGSLISMGKATSAGNSPVALAVDPFGNFVYVVNSQSSSVSGYKISQVGGTLTALNPPTLATGGGPVSIAIRPDGAWLFVANNLSGTLSQYSIIPASGALSSLPAITTDNFPWGVAVK